MFQTKGFIFMKNDYSRILIQREIDELFLLDGETLASMLEEIKKLDKERLASILEEINKELGHNSYVFELSIFANPKTTE